MKFVFFTIGKNEDDLFRIYGLFLIIITSFFEVFSEKIGYFFEKGRQDQTKFGVIRPFLHNYNG